MRLTKQSGISLTEVMVAVLVLALAVIGSAGLQWRALRSAHETGMQSAASRIAADLAESMRAFRGVVPGQAGMPHIVDFEYDSTSGMEPAALPCLSVTCTPAQLAAFELQDAARRIREQLPEGRVRICRDGMPWEQAREALSWDCSTQGTVPAPIVVKIGWRTRQGTPLQASPPLLALAVGP